MNERKRRIAENEALFRSVNEQVSKLNATLSTHPELMQIVCECGTQSCLERIPILPRDYARIRDDATAFVTKPGHDFPDTEMVVDKEPAYWTVRKHAGTPAEFARETAPQ